MIMEALNEHLETLAGYVFDNDKLVTYKWLSKELCVHVNIAKQILWEFYQKYRTNNDIECTYLLIGLLKDNGMRVEVVKESALSKAKEKFKKIISEHLYSVHKPLADLELLASSGSGDVNYSAIKCDACKERSEEEMQLLRWGTKATKKIATENIVNSKLIDSVNVSKAEKNSVTAKKNGFNNLFNMAKKTKSPEKLKSSFQKENTVSTKKDEGFSKEIDLMENNKSLMEKDKEEAKKLMEKEKNSMEEDENCVQKDSTKKNKGSAVNSTTKKVSPKSNPNKKENLDNFFGKLTSSKPTEVILPEKGNDKAKKGLTEKKKTGEKQNLRGKKRNRSKETVDTCKKRKRIVVQSDSSDSEVQSDVEITDLIPESEPATLVQPKSPSPPRVKHEGGKRKVLKLINRTYKEGEYIVTKKEHVYVSCSEDEEEKKEEETSRDRKKIDTKMEKVKKKQSTLTDFFKRS